MAQTSFDQRVARLTGRHERLALGVTFRVGPDGLIEATPGAPRKRGRLLRLRRLRPLLAALGMGFGLKALLFVGLGEATFEGRRSLLLEAGAMGRAVAWVMQPDPVVRALADAVAQVRLAT
jgi:hypothetical protein